MRERRTHDQLRLAAFLKSYSIEITARDRASRDAVTQGMPPGSEIFIADLPDQSPSVLLEAARAVRQKDLEPVPHLVARNIKSEPALDALLGRLRRDAEVRSVLATGGDRDEPLGAFSSGLDLLQTGSLKRHGISRVALVCYPEGHPKIGDRQLSQALDQKLAAAVDAGFEVLLISQFAFAPEPILAFVKQLRGGGITAPLRVGVAGPAAYDALIAFGEELGVGASLDALRQRRGTSGHAVETPEHLLSEVARVQSLDPSLGIEGAHFYPFGSAESCVAWPRAFRAEP